MPTWSPHALVAFGGRLNTAAAGADQEIWQCGVRVTNSAGGALTDPNAYMLAITPTLAQWFQAVDPPNFPNTAALDWVKVNNIGTNGKYSDPGAVNLVDYPGGRPGANAFPNQSPDILCLALSWGTAKAVRRGSYASHGRIYPPNYLLSTGGLMRVPTSTASIWRDKGKALLALLAVGPFNAIPVVASGHNGEIEPITSVRVGDVLDVQRRRKDALRENYAVANFP